MEASRQERNPAQKTRITDQALVVRCYIFAVKNHSPASQKIMLDRLADAFKVRMALGTRALRQYVVANSSAFCPQFPYLLCRKTSADADSEQKQYDVDRLVEAISITLKRTARHPK
ncbi:hypothetical protein LTS18_008859, partial [Coniosporium uncinatum]